MAYFNELPFINYPLRFENQSSNRDYVLVRNIFRRAKIQERIANYATAFEYYQLKDDERPDQIAEKIYGDPELDWIILITNNIINYPANWPLSNESLYNYLIDKYETEENLNTTHHLETNEIRDEYNRLVIPEKLKTDSDFYEEFTTVENKTDPLLYDINFYPLSSSFYNLQITTNLGQYVEIWERNNLDEGQTYKGQQYRTSEIHLKDTVDIDLYPSNIKIDYSYLSIYDRNNNENVIFNPITLNGWPYTWGGNLWIYTRENTKETIELKSNVNFQVDITDDFRLYTISKADKIDKFTYTEGTVLEEQADSVYTVENLSSTGDGVDAVFEIKRNNQGEIVRVNLINGGRLYNESEILSIPGSLIGGLDFKDDIQITVKEVSPYPQFRFISIGDGVNNPYPNVKITSMNKTGMSYMNASYEKQDVYNNQRIVTNYEYEVDLNENTRQILILKPEFLGAFIGEFKNIMRYDTSSETLNNRVKQVTT